mmetsp:Transcript_139278/g.445256  ORF Transcript_139278/g.445256 Transcript_139278/m.445256 type:complete len:331 (+) Transcript_139278:870-1862(+)
MAPAAVRRNEQILLVAAIRQVRVVQVGEKVGVVGKLPKGEAGCEEILLPRQCHLGGRRQVEGVQVQVDALRRWHTRRQHLDEGPAQVETGSPLLLHVRAGDPRGRDDDLLKWKSLQAHLNTSIDDVHAAADAAFPIPDPAVADLDLGVASLGPELRDLGASGVHCLATGMEPRLVQPNLALDQELCQHRRLRHFAQVVEDAPSLRDQVEVFREVFGILHQWMVWPGNRSVLEAVIPLDLLPRLNCHLHARDEHAVLRELHLCPSDDEPLPRAPLLILPGAIEATLHADDGLLARAHGELFEVVIGLEHDLAQARPCQPRRLEALHLPTCL